MRNPTVLVVDDAAANRAFVAAVLNASGWIAVEAEDGVEAVALAQQSRPHLIVMDIDMPRMDGWAATAAIRALGAPLGDVPILAYTTLRLDDETLRSRGLDGRLPKPSAPEALAAAVARWRPDGQASGAHRLGDLFGKEQIERLVMSFRGQLVEALAEMDSGADVGTAHRIAGVAGTLGFAEVSASWLRLSEGDMAAIDDARRDARMAITGIDRDFG